MNRHARQWQRAQVLAMIENSPCSFCDTVSLQPVWIIKTHATQALKHLTSGRDRSSKHPSASVVLPA